MSTPCRCCLIPIEPNPGGPHICAHCWEKLTPGDRAAHMDRLAMNRTVERLSEDVGGFLDKAREALEEGTRLNRFGGRN
jgi:hypothetical protein